MKPPRFVLFCCASLPLLAFGQSTESLKAVSDGKADATAAIQAAITKDGIATLPSGTYRITKSIRIGSNQGLVGTGTIFVDYDVADCDSEDTGAFVLKGENMKVEGLTIRKKFVDGSYGTGVFVTPKSTNVSLTGLDISGYSARYGIMVVESSWISITNCYIHDFMMDADADMIHDSPAGIIVKRTTDSVVSNNRVARIDVGPHGLQSISPLVPKYGPQHHQSDCMTIMQSRRIALTGNTLDRSGEGFDMLLSQECTLVGNTIRGIWFQAIKLLGVSNCVISGNFCSDSYEGIGLATHSKFNAECENNSVTGNVLLNIGTPGPFGDDPTTRVKYHGTIGIDLGGTSKNNVIANNVIRSTSPDAKLKAPIMPNSQPNIIVNNVLPDGMNK